MNELSVELLNTGSELLLGTVRDAHLQWLGERLFPLGLRVTRQVTVPDGDAIRVAMRETFGRAGILIVTGGLGPTTDDITRDVAADLLGRKLLPHVETLERIKERCRRRGFTFQERMALQAMVPEGAVVFPNDHGTAPGLYLPATEGTPHLFLLPGPPRELQPMARDHLLPQLGRLTAGEGRPACKVYRVVGMGESLVEAMVGLEISRRGDLEVGYCARPDEVDFRLIGDPAVIAEVEPMVIAALGEHLITGEHRSLEEAVVSLLQSRAETLATAESCTGGLLANRITDVPGASQVFLEGVIAYGNEAKTTLLGVSPDLLAAHGAVSAEVAQAMAEGVLERSGATHALSTTGIAGPGGATASKPLGLVWMALASQGGETLVWRADFPTDRKTFKQRTTQSALDHLRRTLEIPPR